MSTRLLIAGLGNPGAEYEKTRHNFGFMLLDACAGSTARWRQASGGLYCEGVIGGETVFFLKPQRFMNLSGPVVKGFLDYYSIDHEKLIVVCDDLDLPLGTLRLREAGGDGGHKGLKSIISALGSNVFVRLRLGIGRPLLPEGAAGDAQIAERLVTGWVLGGFLPEELATVRQVIDRGVCALEQLVTKGVKAAQNIYNS